MAKRSEVLLFTHSGDWGPVDWVARELRSLGAKALRVDSDRFPSDAALSASFPGKKSRPGLSLDGVDLSSVRAVWWRRLWPGTNLSAVAPEHQDRCARMSRVAYFDSLSLMDCTWVNPLAAGLRAESKLLQLREASSLGLKLPETLVTNRPAEVRAFAKRHRRIITKLLLPIAESMEGSPDFFYTSEVSRAHLAALDGLRHSPQIFQPLVEKKSELRVVVVGDALFVGELDASVLSKGALDWRKTTVDEGVRWREGALPRALAKKALALTRRLGLSFAALDFIVPEKGEPLFLELNPAGEWGFLEHELSFPISRHLTRLLLP